MFLRARLGEQSLTELFREDHERMEALFDHFRGSKHSDPAAARSWFLQFERHLRQRIEWEEELIFPLFDDRTGPAGRQLIEDLCEQHRQLEQLAAAIERRLARLPISADVEAERFWEVAAHHHDKEEGIAYPLIDDMLSEADRERLFARLEERMGLTAGRASN